MKLFIIKLNSILLISILNLVIIPHSMAQDQGIQISRPNSFYIGLFSSKPYYSINYERFIIRNKYPISVNVGFSLINDGLAIPIGINMITGSHSLHPEISLNFMPYIDQYQSMFSTNDISDKYIYIIPGFGCRYMKNASNLFYRVALCPSVELDPPSSDFWNMDARFLFIINAGIGIKF